MDGRINSGLRWITDENGLVIGYRNPTTDQDEVLSAGGAGLQRDASTALELDSVETQYAPLTISGATEISVAGSTGGASASMLVIANGTNIPTISGADEWASSFGYLNTDGIPNRLDVWHDGIARRYAWSQQATPSVAPVAPSFSVAPAINGTPQASVATSYTSGTYSGTPTPTSAQQWSLDGVDVPGATTATPTLPADSAGKALRVRQTVTNSSGSVSSTSSPVTVAAAPAGDADVAAWMVRVGSAGGTVSSPTQAAVAAFVASAKSSGYWTKFRRLNLMCGDAAAALVPLVNASGASVDTNVASMSYSEAAGFSTNGTTSYLNTGYTPSEATGGLSMYLRTTQASTTTGRVFMGCRDSGATQVFRLAGNTAGSGTNTAGSYSGAWGGVVGASNVQPTGTGGNTAGMYHVSRTSSTLSTLYKNGSSVGTMATSTTPGSAANALYVGCNNSAGTAAAWLEAASAIGAYGIDSGMTSGEAADYRTHMQTFQTALSRNV
jgi:hypothetical protein